MKWCCQEPGRICEAAFQAATATTVETPPPAADALRGGRLPAAAACRPSAVSLGCSTSELTKRVPFSRSQLWSWTERGGRCQPSPRPDRSQRLQLMLSCRTREITAALGLGLHLLLAAGEEPARVCDALGRMNRTDSGALARAEGGGGGGDLHLDAAEALQLLPTTAGVTGGGLELAGECSLHGTSVLQFP